MGTSAGGRVVRVAAEHRTLDVAGHYSRSDIFSLVVNRSAQEPVSYRPG